MRKIYFLLTLITSVFTLGQTVAISGIMDGPCTGGTPKAIALTVNGTIDFTGYSIGLQTNARTTWTGAGTATADISALGMVSDNVVYVVNDMTLFLTEFPSVSPSHVLEATSVTGFNGDDRVRLVDGASIPIDIYGVDGLDGSNEVWEYTDSYATRNAGTTPSTTFNPADWTIPGRDALDNQGACSGANILEDIVDFNTFLSAIDVQKQEVELQLFVDANQTLQVRNAEVASLEVYNLNGQLVRSAKTNAVNLTGLSSGVYIANVQDKNGALAQEKFVKK